MKTWDKALLIDDDSISNFVTASFLKKYKLISEIQIVYNGKEALDLLYSGYIPDLLILDLDLPLMSGYTFYTNFKQSFPDNNIEIIILTSEIQEKDSKLFLNDGIKVLYKPLTEEKVCELVD